MKITKESFFGNKYISAVSAIVCCLLWGSAFACIKKGYEIFGIGDDYRSQILFAGIRFFIAGVMVIVAGSISEKKVLIPKKQSIGYVGALALTQTVMQYVFFYIGLAHTTGVNASVINGAGNLFTIVIACLIKQDKITVRKAVGCILGFGGVLTATLFQGVSGEFSFLGEGFILISAVSYGFSGALIKKFSSKENPVTLSGYQFLTGGAIMIIAGAAAGGRIETATAGGIFLLLYMAFISAAAYTLWGLLLKYNNVSRIAVYGFVNPIAGSLLSAVILNEYSSLGIFTLVALVLVAAGIFVVNYNKTDLKEKKSPQNTEQNENEENGKMVEDAAQGEENGAGRKENKNVDETEEKSD